MKMYHMSKTSPIRLVLVPIMVVLASLACSSGAPAEPAITPQATATGTPLPTATLAPTFTPRPTSTHTPVATPTPIPVMGEPVSSVNYEITLIDALYRPRIYPGGGYYYDPKPGYMFVDVGLKAKSLSSYPHVLTSNIVILDENGQG
jgi:hypothetical protein